jgi:hypothetical protein
MSIARSIDSWRSNNLRFGSRLAANLPGHLFDQAGKCARRPAAAPVRATVETDA